MLTNVTHPAVAVSTLPKPRLMVQLYFDLQKQGISIDRVKYPNWREWLYNYSKIQPFLARVHHMTHETDLYVWGTFFSPLLGLFVAEAGAPLIYQGGEWLLRVGTKSIPWEKVSELYTEVCLNSSRYVNLFLNERRSELLAAIAGILYKNDPSKWNNMMNKAAEIKDFSPAVIKALSKILEKAQDYSENHHK